MIGMVRQKGQKLQNYRTTDECVYKSTKTRSTWVDERNSTMNGGVTTMLKPAFTNTTLSGEASTYACGPCRTYRAP
jgi:hypothetical protein